MASAPQSALRDGKSSVDEPAAEWVGDRVGAHVPAPTPALGRLLTRAEFVWVRKGRTVARPGVVVQARPPERDVPGCVRLGFTASKKVGNAVVRNRCKRRLREAARQLAPIYARPGVDYVLIARAGTPDRPWLSLLDDVKSALNTIHKTPF